MRLVDASGGLFERHVAADAKNTVVAVAPNPKLGADCADANQKDVSSVVAAAIDCERAKSERRKTRVLATRVPGSFSSSSVVARASAAMAAAFTILRPFDGFFALFCGVDTRRRLQPTSTRSQQLSRRASSNVAVPQKSVRGHVIRRPPSADRAHDNRATTTHLQSRRHPADDIRACR